MITGFSKIRFNGKGIFLPPNSKKFAKSCQPGDIVWWKTEDNYYSGVLRKWQDSVAIIESGNNIVHVELSDLICEN